jgi:hypothetical protein
MGLAVYAATRACFHSIGCKGAAANSQPLQESPASNLMRTVQHSTCHASDACLQALNDRLLSKKSISTALAFLCLAGEHGVAHSSDATQVTPGKQSPAVRLVGTYATLPPAPTAAAVCWNF